MAWKLVYRGGHPGAHKFVSSAKVNDDPNATPRDIAKATLGRPHLGFINPLVRAVMIERAAADPATFEVLVKGDTTVHDLIYTIEWRD